MASKTFSQLALGTLKGVNLRNSGCGAVAIADIVHNIDTSITVNKVAEYLINNSYLSNSGTTRVGLTRGLDHFGFDSLYFKDEHRNSEAYKTFFEILKASKDNPVWAIALMVGTSDGAASNRWTKGGHYIAITGYKQVNGVDHYYVRDGMDRTTGWHPLSDFSRCMNVGWIITKYY